MPKTAASDPVQEVIGELKKLPGIGPKSAQRIAFHLIRRPEEDCRKLARAISELKSKLILCSECHNISSVDPCRICSDATRNRREICVVEEPFNVMSIERSGEYRGVYHVLHGVISPINGIGPDDLKLKGLLDRLKSGEVEEVILAVEGVQGVRVYGAANPVTGQIVAAEVKLFPGYGERETEQCIRAACRARLERHKQPRLVRLVDALPTANQKVLRRAVH